MVTGIRLPVDFQTPGNQRPMGFGTPQVDRAQQQAFFAPRRVLPIIFLPGIMGSNLRIASGERMRQLGRTNAEDNIAWRPDSIDGVQSARSQSNASAADRQLRLDPNTTAVDIYNPESRQPDFDGDGRHGNVKLGSSFRSPFLVDDPPGQPGGRTAVQKARERGWGEVFFNSYGPLLQLLETRLNNVFVNNKMQSAWADVIGVDPIKWGADKSLPQAALTEEELRKATSQCWFPVHAIGYNWLQSNGDSARIVAARIKSIVDGYAGVRDDKGRPRFECEKVIVITHSMGGLVGRALIHPDYGDLQESVLGMVHGVQPAVGAAAAYKRMRAGFEDPGVMHGIETSVGAKVAGNHGNEVAAVLANSPGGLQLLPCEAYGEAWLQVMHRERTLLSLPVKDPVTGEADPYEQIYKLKDKWYGLFPCVQWINPSGLAEGEGGGSFNQTAVYLSKAKKFHASLKGFYHRCTYAHYGDDRARMSFGAVVWQISSFCADTSGWESWSILRDSRQGQLEFVRYDPRLGRKAEEKLFGPRVGVAVPNPIGAALLPPDEAGDQTVPVRSADDQFQNGKCEGIFRQTGYEHQESYRDACAIACTLYSIVRIAQQAKWKKSQ